MAHEDAEVREAAMSTLLTTARLRGQHELLSHTYAPPAAGGLQRSIYTAADSSTTAARLVRCEGGPSTNDHSVNEVYDAVGATYDLFRTVFQRDSLDGKGLRLDAVVHFGQRFNNAFWNGSRLIVGDGDGKALMGFTRSVDVIAHELTHGVTDFTSNLEYHGQSGALNESMADVFASLVKQHTLGQRAGDADWLIGAGVLGPLVPGVALRSLEAPGTAYVGDDQPSNMSGYVETPDNDQGDWGGVHRNAGIPNHAFYLLATRLGGNAWDDAGQIWYDTLLALRSNADFKACAAMTYYMAGRRFGVNSRQQQEVGSAWDDVGVSVAPTIVPAGVAATAPSVALLAYRLKAVVTQIGQATDLASARA
ncbi:MAG: M4 family metallopeptidase [Gemmatimonadaceae bacterium]